MTFSLIKQYFSNNDIDNIIEEVNRLKLLPDIKDNKIWKYYEYNDNSKLSRIEHFVNSSKKLKNISNMFFNNNSNYVLMKDKLNFKYPNGEGFIEHQDIAAGWGKYGSNHISIAIPLCDTTIENGCLYFADIGINKILTEEFTDLTDNIVHPKHYKSYPTKKGDIIIFDSFIPHKSYINKSNSERNILYFTYTFNNKNIKNLYEDYHSDKFKNCPPDIYKDINIKYRSGNTYVKR